MSRGRSDANGCRWPGAHGRRIAAPVVAAVASPPADVSARDGYAVRDGDSFAGAIGPGECMRIFTDAAMPAIGPGSAPSTSTGWLTLDHAPASNPVQDVVEQGFAGEKAPRLADADPPPLASDERQRLDLHAAFGTSADGTDVEMPIAVSFLGRGYAVMMATPADLENFTVGFARSVRLIDDAGQVTDVSVMT